MNSRDLNAWIVVAAHSVRQLKDREIATAIRSLSDWSIAWLVVEQLKEQGAVPPSPTASKRAAPSSAPAPRVVRRSPAPRARAKPRRVAPKTRPKPEFTPAVPKPKHRPRNTQARERAAVAIGMISKGPVAVSEVAKKLELSNSSAGRILRELKNDGAIFASKGSFGAFIRWAKTQSEADAASKAAAGISAGSRISGGAPPASKPRLVHRVEAAPSARPAKAPVTRTPELPTEVEELELDLEQTEDVDDDEGAPKAHVQKVYEALIGADDAMSAEDVAEETGLNEDEVRAALGALRSQRKAFRAGEDETEFWSVSLRAATTRAREAAAS